MSDIEDMIERDLNLGGGKRGGKRGGRGGRSGGRGGGGRGGGGENREVLVSKALSRLLRHAADEAKLALDSEGYARVDQVVSSFFWLLDYLSVSPPETMSSQGGTR